MAEAMFGAGCFWGIEEEFAKMKGVRKTEVGYSGGDFPDPGYQDVCSGRTGHAEVVRLEYDPQQVSYPELLETFWAIHDPTTPDRQGPDVGSQYRSAVFYYTSGQKKEAESSKQKVQESGRFPAPIVTEIVPAGEFYRAEEYHQKYLAKQRQGF